MKYRLDLIELGPRETEVEVPDNATLLSAVALSDQTYGRRRIVYFAVPVEEKWGDDSW